MTQALGIATMHRDADILVDRLCQGLFDEMLCRAGRDARAGLLCLAGWVEAPRRRRRRIYKRSMVPFNLLANDCFPVIWSCYGGFVVPAVKAPLQSEAAIFGPELLPSIASS